jgi:uncharacterized membrane-anchored protein
VLVGVDAGADALLDAGCRIDVVVGDLDTVTDRALTGASDVVVRRTPDGAAPALPRLDQLGVEPHVVSTGAAAEDLALLLAHHRGASLVVTAGSHATLEELLDTGRGSMASGVATRLRLGSRLVDAAAVARLSGTGSAAWLVLLLLVAAVAAVIAALLVTPGGQALLAPVTDALDGARSWLEERWQ